MDLGGKILFIYRVGGALTLLAECGLRRTLLSIQFLIQLQHSSESNRIKTYSS
jgi:hypothetical protein